MKIIDINELLKAMKDLQATTSMMVYHFGKINGRLVIIINQVKNLLLKYKRGCILDICSVIEQRIKQLQ